MPKLQIVGAGRRDDDNSQANPSRLVNCFRENIGGEYVIKAVLGTQSFADLGGVFMRAMEEIGGKIIAANGGKLYCIDKHGTSMPMGDITSSAQTSISGNNGKIAVAAGGTYFVHDGAEIVTPSTGDIENVGSVSFLGQRTFVTELNGRRIAWSDVADAETFDPLNFATAEQLDDNIVRGVAINGQYWIFKRKSIEQWALTGASDVIRWRPGAVTEIGLKDFGLYCDIPNGGFFVGSDNIAHIITGSDPQPVSVRAVETSIKEGTPTRAFYYEQEGHKFCVIRFDDRPAWVYDVSSNEWHERAEGTSLQAWSAVDTVSAFGEHFIGLVNGKVRKLVKSNRDADGPLLRQITSDNLEAGGRHFSLNMLELRGTVGQTRVPNLEDAALDLGDGTSTGQDNSPFKAGSFPTYRQGAQIRLSLSKDRGETFGKAKSKHLGELGDYRRTIRHRGWGGMRNACLRIEVSDPAEVTLEAVAEVEIS